MSERFVKVETDWLLHRKVMRLDLAARGLWLTGLIWAKSQGTGGTITTEAVALVCRTDENDPAVRQLVEAGLWEPTAEGWAIHDYAEHQSLSPRERGRVGGLKSAEARLAAFGTAQPQQPEPAPLASGASGVVRGSSRSNGHLLPKGDVDQDIDVDQDVDRDSLAARESRAQAGEDLTTVWFGAAVAAGHAQSVIRRLMPALRDEVTDYADVDPVVLRQAVVEAGRKGRARRIDIDIARIIEAGNVEPEQHDPEQQTPEQVAAVALALDAIVSGGAEPDLSDQPEPVRRLVGAYRRTMTPPPLMLGPQPAPGTSAPAEPATGRTDPDPAGPSA